MNTKAFIDKVLITLEVGDSTPLLILLGRDGAVHRKGNGDPRADLPLIQAISHDGHFEALMMTIPEEIFVFAGLIRQPNPVGTECRLTLIFQGRNEVDFSFRVIYGADSEGPPKELAEILINAVKITEPWYQQQIANEVRETKENNGKWWQVWK